MKTRMIADAQASDGIVVFSPTVGDSDRHRSRLSLKTVSWSLVACLAAAAMCTVNAGTPSSGASANGHVSIRAAGRGWPNLNLRDGYRTSVDYRGNLAYVAALKLGIARPLSLASADFDHNGTPDVVAGYAIGSTGVVSVQRGNPDAFAPTDASVFDRLQQGYEPESLLPNADLYPVPASPDFLVAGNFSRSSTKDILVAANGGGLYLLKGDGTGQFEAPREIPLPGPVTTLAAGEFGAADGFTDIAVGVSTPHGDALLIFDDAAQGFVEPVVALPLAAPATAIEFGGLDDDPFQDVAVASGSEVLVVHGWGRVEHVDPASRVERIEIGADVRGLAIGEFVWDRAGRSEIAALTGDGNVHVVRGADLDTRPFTQAELAARTRARLAPLAHAVTDVESTPSWKPKAGRAGWIDANQFAASSFAGVSSIAAKPLLRANVSYRESDDLLLIGESKPKLEFVHEIAHMTWAAGKATAAAALDRTTLDVESAPVAVLPLPKKLNGTRDFVVLDSANAALTLVPQAPNTTITVDRFDDPAGAALTAASACTGAANDCSLRGAIEFANNVANNNTTISLPAGTYVLSINGKSGETDGCAVGGVSSNSTGDLGLNQTMSLVGAGAATTIIRQTGTGPANDGDRVMCLAETFPLNIAISMSALTVVGGRDGASGGTVQVFGGGGIIGGEKGNSLTLTNVVFANNWTVGAGLGGGGVQITGGDLTITNSTFGGSSAPGLYTDRSSTNTANASGTSGGGISFTPSAPMHTGATGILTVTNSTLSRNTSQGAGGAGADVYILAFALPGGIGTGSTLFNGNTVFQNNQALSTGSGAGLLNESIPTTVQNTTFTNNAANNRGGAIYVAGSTLLLDGSTGAILMSGNTAASGGTSMSTASAVTVSGTNTTLGGSIEMSTGGSWTMSPGGSAIAPTDVVVTGGTFTTNDGTVNIGGNLTIQPAAIVGATFNGNTGTVNLAGNLTYTSGGSGPATTFNAGTGTFNFNGSGAQSISNNASITFFNLTDSNTTQPLTLNNSLAVNANLTVNGANAILSPAATTVISGTGTLTGTGTARATRTAATPDFLSQYTMTNKALTSLNIDYNGAGTQTVNNTPAYSRLTISGSGTKTLQGNTTITSNLNIVAGSTFASGNNNFSLGGNWTNGGTFTAGTGTVTFAGSSGIQSLTGNTTFFNLTLNNTGATTNFGSTTTTIGNDLVASAGTMDGSSSTITFTGVTDNAGAISGAAAKNFFNLQINSPATISNSVGGDVTIENNYTNTGTFVQSAGLTTIFDLDNTADGAHTLSGAGTTTFGNVTINGANTVDAGTHSFNVVGANFNVQGTFTGNASTATFNGGVAQSIGGNGVKNFSGLLINNANGVQVANGTSAVDASVSGLLTLNTDLTVASGAILQQSGTSAGVADVLGTVRRTDLGGVSRSFGNLNNAITINSGTAPTQLDFNLVKSAPATFPAAFKVVPRDIVLTPTGGSGMSATLTLRYIDPAELTPTGITESSLTLWKNVGGTTWTPQGGAVDTTNNFVSLSGISSFSEWAIGEAPDLTLTQANSVSGSAVVGQPWTWTLTAHHTGASATFTNGQTILSDNLPNSGVNYGAPSVQNVSNITGGANISCAIVSNDLTCTASGGSVMFNGGSGSFDVAFSATAQVVGSYVSPRSGGSAGIDPANVVLESNEGNNAATADTVTVSKASTATTITSHSPNPSEFGQALTVQWSVAVTAPGALGAALTGNVTVSDGTASCNAAVSAGQCNISFASAGAKTLTATYAGDGNYNGSTSPGVSHTVLAPPTIAKAFAPTSIQTGANSTVTLTLSNSNASALTNGAFSDTLANMSAVGGAVTGTCVGTTPNTLGAGTTALAFTGIAIPASGSCTVIFSVTSSSIGVQPNTTSGVTTTQTPVAGTASNTANLTVFTAPTIAKAFAPTSIQAGANSTVTLTLSNSNGSALTNGAFSDTLTNMSAAGGAVTGSCVGTTPNTLGAGSTALAFTGITIPASGSCTVIFSVTSSSAGTQPNTTSGVTTTQTPVAGTASNTANLTVIAAPTIAKAFAPTSIQTGANSTVTLTLSNSNGSAMTNGAFSDTLTNMSAVGGAVTGTCVGTTPNTLGAGATALAFTGIAIPASGSCTVIFSVTSSSAGVQPNTTSGVTTTQTPVAGTASNTANLTVTAAPTIAKAFAPASIQAGANSTVTLTLSNSNGIALTGAAFNDTLANMSAVGGAVTGTCAGTTPNTLAAGATALAFTGITIPASGSCTVIFSVTSNAIGVQPNTTSGVTTTQTPVAGTVSNTANLTVSKASTTTAVTPSPGTITLGDTVTFTATVTDGANTATGIVTFFDGNTPIGSATLNGVAGNDQAAITTSLLSATGSPHSIKAVYQGTPTIAASTSAPISETVNPRTSTTGVVVSPTTVVVGQSSTATITVTDSGSVPPGTADVFAATGAPTTGRTGFTATLFGDGRVLVAGGTDANGNVLNGAQIYSASGASFTSTGNLNGPRTGAVATLLPNGQVLVAGGSSDGTATGALNTAELFNPSAGTFTATSNTMNAARFGMTATLLNTGKVLLAGGANSGGTLNSAELYDPSTDTFTATDNLNAARSGASATLLGTGKVLVAGGSSNGTANGALNSAEVFDPAGNAGAGTFTSVAGANPTLSASRWQPEAAALLSSRVLIAGGANSGGALISADLYDPVADSFSATGEQMAQARSGGTAVALPSGMVLLAGGTTSQVTDLYDSDSDQFNTTGALQQSNSGLQSVLLNNGQVLVVGLTTNVTPVSDAELYAPSFNPLGTVAVSSSEATDVISGACVLTPSTATASTCASTVTPANIAVSPHTITGTYAADVVHAGSSNTASLTVDKTDTATTATSSANPSVSGQSVTFTATVSPVAPGGGTPTGTVTFLDAGNPIGSGSLSGGIATFTTSALTVGNHTITTSYGGDSNFNGSTGSLTGNPQVVDKADTSTDVTSSQNPSLFGQAVTFTATVSAVAPGVGTPTGTVTFLDGGAPIGTGTLNGSGIATLTTSALSIGNHSITTSYGGDGDFNGSTGSLTGNPQVVSKSDSTTTVASSQNPSVFGQSVTFTATVSPVAPGAGTPTGTVSFLDGGNPIGSGTLSGGIATFATSALAAGNHTITTAYAGDGDFNGSPGSLTGNPQVVNKADTTTATVTSSQNPSKFGQSVTFTATISTVAPGAGTPTGTVTFLDGGNPIGSGPLSGGIATFSTAALATGSHTITTSYAGDGNVNGSSGSLTGNPQVVDKADTTTTLTSSQNPSVFGEAVTFTATLTAVAPGAGSATGTVSFLDGGNPIGTGTLNGSGIATFTTSALTVGNHTITTSYGGDGDFNGSSGSLTGNPQVVNKADTTTALTSSQNPSVIGQSITFTATVSATAPGSGTPTGNVTFLDGGTPLATVALSGGSAIYATSALALGNHTITTSYSGDGNFKTGTGTLTGNPQVINKPSTNTAVSSSLNPSVFGQGVTFTATVTVVAPGSGTATGTVTFRDGGTSIGTGTLDGSGVAKLTTAQLATGNHTITADYGGDTNFNTSTGALSGNPQVVSKADTATAVTSSVNPSVFGQSITFTATLSAVAPGAGTPTGVVTFLDGGSPIGTGTLNGSGVATFTSAALAIGSHTITTSYGGDGNFNGSTGSMTGNPQVVNKANTSTAVTSAANPSVFGQSVTFTATVSAVAPGAGTATGSVSFLDGGSPIGTGTLNSGVATFTTSVLAIGNHTITTSYAGDGNFNGSTGSLTGNPQVVNKASSLAVTQLTPPGPVTVGASVQLQATLTAVAPGAGTPTGSVTFLDGATTLGTVALSGGTASMTKSSWTVGSHSITASYGGDGNFKSSVSAPAILSITPPARTITSNAVGNGTITPSTQYVVDGNTASFTVTPNNGFTAMMSTDCPEGLGTLNNNVYTTRAISQDCSVTATFSSASATLALTLTDNRSFVHYGSGFINYVVTLTNSSGNDATGLTISGAETSPSSDLDTASGHWQCFGTAAECLPSGTGPFVDGNVTVPANSSVSWIVSIPKRADPPDGLASYAVTVSGTTPTLMQFDTDYFVIFRDSFDQPNGDGTGTQSLSPDSADAAWDGSALALSVPASSGVIDTVLEASAPDHSGFRVEHFGTAEHDWLRVVAFGSEEQPSFWVAVEPLASVWLGTAAMQQHRELILVGGEAELDVPIAASASWKVRAARQVK